MHAARWIVVGLLVGAIGGCSEKVLVLVNCASTAAPAVECEVVQAVGKADVDVCWDFAVTCANGVEVKAERTCQKLKDGVTARTVIPAEKLTGLDKCGGVGAPVGKVSGLTINGEPAG